MNHPLKSIPLHEQCAQVLRQEIVAKRVGDRLSPIAELAKRFGVSIATIQNALMILTQEGLIVRRQGSGCYVAPRNRDEHAGKLPTEKAPTRVAIFVMSALSATRSSYFWMAIADHLRTTLAEKGIPSRLYIGWPTPEGEPMEPGFAEFFADISKGIIRGAIAIGGNTRGKWADMLRESGVPVVGHWLDSEYCVRTDDEAMVREAARQLLAQGRRKISVIGWTHKPEGWAEILSQEMREFGVSGVSAELQEKWIQADVQPWVTGLGWARFREIWTASAYEKPDGLIVMDDVIFQDTALAIMELGIKVPRQLSCVIHSNRGSGHFYPFPVTRMEFDPVEFAVAMLDQLETLMAGRKPEAAQAQRMIGFQMLDANAIEKSDSTLGNSR